MDERLVERAVEEIRAGRPVVLATDTVYGLCADPHRPEAIIRLQQLKGRDETQPTALLAFDIDTLMGLVPELTEALLRALLPGPLTLVLPNPASRFSSLDEPKTIRPSTVICSGTVRARQSGCGPSARSTPGAACCAR